MTTSKVQSEFIATNAISGTIIADNAITATHIATNAISGVLIQDSGIVSTMIAANNVTAAKIVTNGVLTRHVLDDNITAAKLANSINTDIATGVTANTTANAALPKAGGTMTGDLLVKPSASGATATSGTVGTFESNDNTEVSILGGSSSVLGLNFGHSGDNDEGKITFNTTAGSEDLQIVSSKEITLDAAGDIILDADDEQVNFSHAGTVIGQVDMGSNNYTLRSKVDNKDIEFHGTSSGNVVALKLDMSAAGRAIFNSSIGVGAGTISLPSLSFANDPNTGIYSNSADNLGFVTGGVERGFWSASQLNVTGNGVYNGTNLKITTTENTANDRSGAGFLANGSATDSSRYAIMWLDADNGAFGTGNSGTYFYIQKTGGAGHVQFIQQDDADVFFTTNGAHKRLMIKNDGKIGIGVDGPAGMLHVGKHTSSVASILEGNGNGDTVPLHFRTKANNADVTNYGIFGNAGSTGTDNTIHIGPTNALGVTVTSVGTIGMGSGSGSLAGSIIINNDGGTGVINNAYYNTGLGWEVFDDLTQGDSNTMIGNQAGYKLTTGSNNVGVGRQALANIDTQGTNTGVGAFVLSHADNAASDNTAVGYGVLQANSTGDNNTAVGVNSMQVNKTGTDNVAVGRNTLIANVGASGNVALGSRALSALSHSSGHNNVAVGRDALKDMNTSAQDNIAIGAYALDASNSGSTSQTIAIGSYAGSGALAGYGNIFIGYQAGKIAAGAFENTIIGRDAGMGITTGDYNVCVGAYAGKDTIAIEGGQHNVFIGYKTRGTHQSHSQAIAIGSDIDAAPGEVAIGTAAMGKIYADFDNDHEWAGGSDVRLKQNITDSTLGLNFINDLRTVTYNWKPNNELPKEWSMYSEENVKDTEIIMTGLIAQEVKTAIDASGVSRFGGWNEDREGIQQIATAKFVFPLIKAVQELTAKVKELEKKLEG